MNVLILRYAVTQPQQSDQRGLIRFETEEEVLLEKK